MSVQIGEEIRASSAFAEGMFILLYHFFLFFFLRGEGREKGRERKEGRMLKRDSYERLL
jgi:hypothetical protein